MNVRPSRLSFRVLHGRWIKSLPCSHWSRGDVRSRFCHAPVSSVAGILLQTPPPLPDCSVLYCSLMRGKEDRWRGDNSPVKLCLLLFADRGGEAAGFFWGFFLLPSLVWAERRPVRNVTSSSPTRPQSIWNLNASVHGAGGRRGGWCEWRIS